MNTLTASYPLTADLYQAGVRTRFRSVALRLLLLCAIGVAAALALLVQDEPIWAGRSILATILLTLSGLALAMLLVAYLRSQRAKAEWLKRVGGGTETLTMDDDGMGLEIPDQRSWIRWSALREVWCGRDAWLFYTRGVSHAVIVAAPALDGAAGTFVRAKAAEAGARVREA